MPTGYTDIISREDITFEQFALRCSRAFGATIELRDESLDAEIPEEFQPSTYHKEKLEEAEKELEDFRIKTDEELQVELEVEFKENQAYYLSKIEEESKLKLKYYAMLAKVQAWVPPTVEHEGLKKFMIEQLQSSVDFDCKGDYYEGELNKPKDTLEEYRKKKLSKLEWNVNYHRENWDNAVAKIENTNKWLKELRVSLKEN